MKIENIWIYAFFFSFVFKPFIETVVYKVRFYKNTKYIFIPLFGELAIRFYSKVFYNDSYEYYRRLIK